jgi:TPR repeat protein
LAKRISVPNVPGGGKYFLTAYEIKKDRSAQALYRAEFEGKSLEGLRGRLTGYGIGEDLAKQVTANEFAYLYASSGKTFQRLYDRYYDADHNLIYARSIGSSSEQLSRGQISGLGYAMIPFPAPIAASDPSTSSPVAKEDPKAKEATENAAELYRKGEERYKAKDYKAALTYYRQAADAGYADAQSNLGYMYENGRGVTKDYAEAVSWYRKAADQGHAYAQFSLGYMYENGYGVTKDNAEAVSWYRKAAAQGHASAQYNLGIMYEYGDGVTKDNAEAVSWYRKAAALGHAVAKKVLERLEK